MENLKAAYLDLCRKFYPSKTIDDYTRDIDFLIKNITAPPAALESPPKTPNTPPAPKKTILTVKQATYLDYVCKRADLGQEVRPMNIADDMGLEAPYLLHCLGALHKAKYLKRIRKGHRKTILVPLMRSNGEKYEKPPVIDGITIHKPAYARGYEPFSKKI